MKLFGLLLLTFSMTGSAIAQFYIVWDKDGYTNVRDSSNTRSKVIDTLNNGHFIFFFEEQTTAWRRINYTHHGKDRAGFVYHDRLKPITDYDSIPLRHHTDNTAICVRDSVKVIVTQKKVDKKKYRFTYDKEGGYIIKVNVKQYWGDDGEMPRQEYKSIVINIGTRETTLPQAALDNLFEPTMWTNAVNYDRINDSLYIQAMYSDGAGSYYVIWRVVKGVYADLDIEYGE